MGPTKLANLNQVCNAQDAVLVIGCVALLSQSSLSYEVVPYVYLVQYDRFIRMFPCRSVGFRSVRRRTRLRPVIRVKSSGVSSPLLAVICPNPHFYAPRRLQMLGVFWNFTSLGAAKVVC